MFKTEFYVLYKFCVTIYDIIYFLFGVIIEARNQIILGEKTCRTLNIYFGHKLYKMLKKQQNYFTFKLINYLLK